jgi:hypothetical protein
LFGNNGGQKREIKKQLSFRFASAIFVHRGGFMLIAHNKGRR